MWNRVADDLAEAHATSLSQNARLLALANISLADATIAVWNAKNTFDSWRPVTAIPNADSDGNPATDPDPAWTPLLADTPVPGVPLGALRPQHRVHLGARRVLRKPHRLHRHLSGPTHSRAQLHQLHNGHRAGRGRARLRRIPLPLLLRRGSHTRHQGRRLRRQHDRPASASGRKRCFHEQVTCDEQDWLPRGRGDRVPPVRAYSREYGAPTVSSGDPPPRSLSDRNRCVFDRNRCVFAHSRKRLNWRL